MDWATKWGLILGFTAGPLASAVWLDYRPYEVGTTPWWVVPLAPIVLWHLVGAAGRGRSRTLRQVLGLLGVAVAGVWWWWMHTMFVFDHASPTNTYTIPAGFATTYLVLAYIGGRRRSRRQAPAQVAESPVGANH
jgi:hypothetical protein